MVTLKAVCAALVLMGTATTATAATVNFAASGFTDQNGDRVGTAFSASVTDTLTDTVSFNVQLDSLSADTGDILLIGLSIDGSLNGATFSNFGTITGDTDFTTCFGTKKCEGGGGFIGGLFDNHTFDAILRVGTNGSASGLNTQVSFDIYKAGLAANLFEAVGLRLQSVGLNPGGGGESLKLINTTPLTPMPLPATAWMLLAALFSMAGFRRFRRA